MPSNTILTGKDEAVEIAALGLVICLAQNLFQPRQRMKRAVHVVPNPGKEGPVTKRFQSGGERAQTIVTRKETGYQQHPVLPNLRVGKGPMKGPIQSPRHEVTQPASFAEQIHE